MLELPIYLKYLVYFLLLIYILRLYLNGPKTKASRDIKDKIIIITGCSAGIGKETAKDLLRRGAKVIFACRDKNKTYGVLDRITTMENRQNATFIQLNLTSLKSVSSFVNEFSKKFDKLDILINNAGVFNEKLIFTEDGLENTLQTNHISHFLLTGLLLKFLKRSDDPRIINVGSEAHRWVDDKLDYFSFNHKNYKMFSLYAISKAANIFFSEHLNEYAEKKKNDFGKILSSCVHPGAVFTEISRTDGKALWIRLLMNFIGRPLMFLFFKDEYMGAQTTLHCCYISREEFSNGAYYSDCKVARKSENIRRFDLEKNLNKLTYNSILKSPVFDEHKQDNDFVELLNLIKKKFEA